MSLSLIELDGFHSITYQTAVDFLLPKHYSGRKPTISYAFGWYIKGKLYAVCTFGKPASNSVCVSLCGKEYSKNVYELNRLCRVDCENPNKYPLSKFVAWCLRELSKLNLIIISYSDTAMSHHGYIYQATNFIYTGATKERTDTKILGKHPRNLNVVERLHSNDVVVVKRSIKHRYIYFCTHSKALKKKWRKLLTERYTILPYPKGNNSSDYVLGDYLKDTVVSTERKY